MSDANHVGVTRAEFFENVNGAGPLLRLANGLSFDEQYYSIARDGDQVNIRRDECREVAASLLAFAEGEDK